MPGGSGLQVWVDPGEQRVSSLISLWPPLVWHYSLLAAFQEGPLLSFQVSDLSRGRRIISQGTLIGSAGLTQVTALRSPHLLLPPGRHDRHSCLLLKPHGQRMRNRWFLRGKWGCQPHGYGRTYWGAKRAGAHSTPRQVHVWSGLFFF